MQNGDTSVAVRLKSLRSRRGWSQNKLSEHAGVSNSTISRIESGEIQSPGVDILRKLSGALRVDLSDLTGEQPMLPRSPEIVGGAVRLPILKRRVHAGHPGWADTGADYFVPAHFHAVYPRARAAIVDGDCMSPYINAGDKVLFDPDRTPVDRQMVVVTTAEGETLLKWYRLDAAGQPYLRSADGEEIRPNGAKIEGVVMEVHRGAVRDTAP